MVPLPDKPPAPDAPFDDRVVDDPQARYPAEAGRYHIYASPGCPFAHRTRIARSVLGLEDVISLSYVHPRTDLDGRWHFDAEGPYADPLHGRHMLDDIYRDTRPGFQGPGTVPLFFDKKTKTVVSGESRDITRFIGTAFHRFQTEPFTLLPEGSQGDVDAMIDSFQATVNWGVYDSASAKDQASYDVAVARFHAELERLDALLADRRFLLGERLTEADVLLYTTLVRHDPVYYDLFGSNLTRVDDHTNLAGWLRDVHQTPGIGVTLDLPTTRAEYYHSFRSLNPRGIVPAGPTQHLDHSGGRAERFGTDLPLSPLARLSG